MGKTSISYAALKVLRNEGLLKGALVLGPLRPIASTWPEEQRTWKEFNDLDVVLLHGKDKERLANEHHDVYLMNFEGLPWLINSGVLRKWFKNGWVDTLLIDELSKFKHSDTARYKLLSKWLHRFTRRWGLTGSPAANGLMNLFAQAYMLDMGATFGPFISHFRARYFTPVGDFGWELQSGAEELIYQRIAPLALRMEAEDYIKLPAVKPVYIKVELPPAARKIYDELEADMLTTLDDGEPLTSPTVAALRNKCRQIAGGAAYLNPVDPITGEPRQNKEWREFHSAKLDALRDLMDELQGHQLLVAYEFGHERIRLLRELGDVPYIGGGVSLKKALSYEAAWNARKLPVMMGHAQSMGHGLNLQKGQAHHIVWQTTTWDYENYDQFNRRLRRRGNNSPIVFVYHIVAKNTVDEAVIYKVKRKERQQNDFFAAMKAYAHARGYDFRGKLRL